MTRQLCDTYNGQLRQEEEDEDDEEEVGGPVCLPLSLPVSGASPQLYRLGVRLKSLKK